MKRFLIFVLFTIGCEPPPPGAGRTSPRAGPNSRKSGKLLDHLEVDHLRRCSEDMRKAVELMDGIQEREENAGGRG